MLYKEMIKRCVGILKSHGKEFYRWTGQSLKHKGEDMFTKKPIIEMFYGRLGDTEHIDCNTKEHDEYSTRLVEADEQLSRLLEKDQKLLDLYRQAIDSLEGVYAEEIACYYAAAFRFGVLLGMDIASYFDEK